MASRSVSKLLADSAELRPLQERLDVIHRLQQRYRTLAPGELAKASRVCAIEGATVVISAASGPVAAALRQLAPRLLAGLREALLPDPQRNSLNQNENPNLTGLRVEVQVERKPPRRRVQAREPLPVEQLSKLAQGLADSPLKTTLERIGKTAQSRRTREKT
jgi:hypothetical protein